MVKDATRNVSLGGGSNQAICAATKPFCQRVTLANGKVVLHGVCAAARWLGVNPASLSALARGVNAIPITWEERARCEFPELFDGFGESGTV